MLNVNQISPLSENPILISCVSTNINIQTDSIQFLLYKRFIRKLQEKESLLNWSGALFASCSADKKNLINHSIYLVLEI